MFVLLIYKIRLILKYSLNFFEGIPESLFEAAQIDGCSPMGIFFKIVLPLSKAALASIGLMFAVTFWNDYTNFKIYIRTDKVIYVDRHW